MEVTGGPTRPTGWRRMLFRAPIVVYRVHLGAVLGTRFVLLHHTGRVSGRPRQSVVEVVALDDRTGAITVASGFGPRSDWYLNVLARPHLEVDLGRRRLAVGATALREEEAAAAMADYGRRHPRAGRELCRYMGMTVDGSTTDFEAAGRRIPMLRLTPTGG